MEINKPRRRFIIISSLAFSGLYIQGCNKDGNGAPDSKIPNNLPTTNPEIIAHPKDQSVVNGL